MSTKVKIPGYGVFFVETLTEGYWQYRPWGESYWVRVSPSGLCETYWGAGRTWQLPEQLKGLIPQLTTS